ncbi:MAG: Glutamine amidotransferase of anthranilate synthase [Candidatus Peregrinibacteria bacterium GW2011_GWA2_47_7]|nr:MAG: Glutamine amidotransferase of anthranilate synthase [Candidatus Peregrinibacteria bacterium GW2011_GWA2_47_7]
MAIQHREFPLYGIQFHPESIGTPVGKIILRNFLRVNSKNAIMRPCRRHVCSAVRHLQ